MTAVICGWVERPETKNYVVWAAIIVVCILSALMPVPTWA